MFATATTAASGGYREELLGQRPAGCECRPRHEADAGGRNPSGPARRNRRDLAALNTQHLLRKPVCGLKAPLGLSCPAGTAALFWFSFATKREHLPAEMPPIKAIESSLLVHTPHRKPAPADTAYHYSLLPVKMQNSQPRRAGCFAILNKNNFSSEHAQSKAAGILNRLSQKVSRI